MTYSASGLLSEKDEDRDEEEEDRDQDEGRNVRASEVSDFSNQIGCNKQADARAGRDDPKSQSNILCFQYFRGKGINRSGNHC